MYGIQIAAEMPDKFGIIIDGWKGNDKVYYIGIYAVYVHEDKTKTPLLALLPPIYETSHSAENRREKIQVTLEWYGKVSLT